MGSSITGVGKEQSGMRLFVVLLALVALVPSDATPLAKQKGRAKTQGGKRSPDGGHGQSAPDGYGAAAAPVCKTVYEHQCSTVNRQECTTVQDRMCSTSFKEECSSDSERKCATVTGTINEQKCQNVN